jgi:hypothetical protein
VKPAGLIMPGQYLPRQTGSTKYAFSLNYPIAPAHRPETIRAVLVLAAHGLLAALRDDTPAVLDVARFPADGKSRTALLSAHGLLGDTIVGFRWSGGTGCATGRRNPLLDCDFHFRRAQSLDWREIGLGQPAVCPLSGACLRSAGIRWISSIVSEPSC